MGEGGRRNRDWMKEGSEDGRREWEGGWRWRQSWNTRSLRLEVARKHEEGKLELDFRTLGLCSVKQTVVKCLVFH